MRVCVRVGEGEVRWWSGSRSESVSASGGGGSEVVEWE